MCAGLASAALLRPLGLHIPLAAVYGYSLSAAIREPLNAPRSALMDEHYKVAISRLGQRVRVAGSAEMGGSLAHKRPGAVQTLYKVLHDWFPGAASRAHAIQEWKGARPMLPDGPPLVGASGIPGLVAEPRPWVEWLGAGVRVVPRTGRHGAGPRTRARHAGFRHRTPGPLTASASRTPGPRSLTQ